MIAYDKNAWIDGPLTHYVVQPLDLHRLNTSGSLMAPPEARKPAEVTSFPGFSKEPTFATLQSLEPWNNVFLLVKPSNVGQYYNIPRNLMQAAVFLKEVINAEIIK